MYQNLSQFIEEKVKEFDAQFRKDYGGLGKADYVEAKAEEIHAFLSQSLRQCAELTVEAIFVDKLPTTVPGAILEAGYWLNKE